MLSCNRWVDPLSVIMKGRIIDFEVLNEGKTNESIQLDIEVDRLLIEMDAKNMNFTIVKNSAISKTQTRH